MTLELVADNPYRVFGVGTQAKNAILTANYKSMMTALLKGEEINLGQDMTAFIKPPLRTPRRLDLAKSRLMSARGRCFYALFWFVDSNRLDHAAIYYLSQNEREKAIKILQSQQTFSSYINLAVLALLEDRYDDAATLYTRCLQDEQLTQDFVQCIIGDQFKIKGAFVLSKVLEVLQRAKERKERDETADERSYAGGGAGVLNKEAQKERDQSRLLPEFNQPTIIENLHLRKQANSFDRHLNDALNNLIERITLINREHGMDGDFLEVELNPNPAAQMVLDEITRFLAINNSLMEAFRQRCFQARERSMFLDYIYNLVSITHYVFHLYAIELGRQYSPAVVQQMRSIIAKLERLYFRLKSSDIDYLIASLRRVEDSLPFYYAVSNCFEKYYLLSDDQHLISNFYEFNKASTKVIDNFNRTFGVKSAYVDCVMHLQDMVVRYNVSFMLVIVNLALRHSHNSKPRYLLSEQELRVDESKMRSFAVANPDQGRNPDAIGYTKNRVVGPLNPATVAGRMAPAPAANGGNGGNGTMAPVNGRDRQGQGPDVAMDKNMAKAMRKQQAREAKTLAEQEKRRSRFFKRKLAHERNKFKVMLDRFGNYAISPNTATLIEVTRHQVERLPPPVSVRTIVVVALLIGAALGAIYLNSWLHQIGWAGAL